MTAKIFDFLLYAAATVVILAIISSATQVERRHKKKADSFDPVEVKEPLIEDELVIEDELDLTSEIIFTSQPSCGPCKAFERDCVAALRKAGWRMTKASPDSRGTPSFDLCLGGKVVASKTGYRSRRSFFQWVKNVVARDR
ncbi:MAG: hypothetical protein ACYSW0_22825 [Planctomycetota bacterium]|jgi:hypothetical protein